jgi:transcriptional regulator with XRE-family HTH domain
MIQKTVSIGKLLRLLRALTSEKLEDIARAVGTSVSTLSNIENLLIEPDLELLRDLADHFEIPVQYFFIECLSECSGEHIPECVAKQRVLGHWIVDRYLAESHKSTFMAA